MPRFLRKLIAASLILLVAAGAAWQIGNARPVYSESASVVFATAWKASGQEPSPGITQSLIATEAMMAQAVMSPAIQAQVRDLGDAVHVTAVPFNRYNMQYPDYAEPSARLTATSGSPVSVQHAFRWAVRLLRQRLAAIQSQARVPSGVRIWVYIAGATGPQVQHFSRARALAGVAILTLMALLAMTRWGHRHPERLMVTAGRPAGHRHGKPRDRRRGGRSRLDPTART